MGSAHAYAEPSLGVLLVLAGFVLALNAAHDVLDRVLYCGLVAQVFVGVLFGTPGAQLLDDPVESSISNLGYLGLVLLVYQGGLSTSLTRLVASSTLAVLVALTGILLPLALSFLLLLLPLGASPLQAFSAGAALSATSLGTAFSTLASSGLLHTHVGSVLTSAAMLDDVVGLIMLQVVTELSTGQGTPAEYAMVVARALGASVGLVVIVVIICRLALRPLYKPLTAWVQSPARSHLVKNTWDSPHLALVTHTALLVALVVAGSYAGTSILLAAFVAGVVVRWWGDAVSGSHTSGLDVYERYYASPTEHILKPFFFASIGFSIPITQLFRPAALWKGLLYALLMLLGKLATGLWLVPWRGGRGGAGRVTGWLGGLASRLLYVRGLVRWCRAGKAPSPSPAAESKAKSTHDTPVTGPSEGVGTGQAAGEGPAGTSCVPPEGAVHPASEANARVRSIATAEGSVGSTSESEGRVLPAPTATPPAPPPPPDPALAELNASPTGAHSALVLRSTDDPAAGSGSSLARDGQDSRGCSPGPAVGTRPADACASPADAGKPSPATSPPPNTIPPVVNASPPPPPSPPASPSPTPNPPQRQTPTPPASPAPSSPPSPSPTPPPPSPTPEKRALRAYAPVLLGLAMVARGEIGFLIASVAQSRGVFAARSGVGAGTGEDDGDNTADELYLVVVWAIVLCTVVGPVAVGALVRRIKRLEAQGRG